MKYVASAGKRQAYTLGANVTARREGSEDREETLDEGVGPSLDSPNHVKM